MFLRQDRDTTYHPARWVKSRGSDGAVARSMGGGGARDTRSRTTAAPTSWFFPGGGRGAGLLVGRVNFPVSWSPPESTPVLATLWQRSSLGGPACFAGSFTVLLCLTRMTRQVHPDYTSSAAGVEAQGEWADQMMYGECLSGHICHRARLGGAAATGSVPPAFCILLRRGT